MIHPIMLKCHVFQYLFATPLYPFNYFIFITRKLSTAFVICLSWTPRLFLQKHGYRVNVEFIEFSEHYPIFADHVCWSYLRNTKPLVLGLFTYQTVVIFSTLNMFMKYPRHRLYIGHFILLNNHEIKDEFVFTFYS